MKNILVVLLIITNGLFAQTKSYHFNVIHNGGVLGTLDATKTTDGNKIIYTSHTNLDYQLLTSVKIEYVYEVVFIAELLEEAKVHIKVKGNDKTNVKTLKTGVEYQFYTGEKVKKIIKLPITNSIVQLIFEEPIGITKVYAEEYGLFHNLNKNGDHTYLKTAPNGNKNTYHYKNGILQKSDVDAGIIKFSIIRKD
tara:strand:+ start:2478 stop:3062 length:585 start_codon:yes stop_codon:yes gene_type:complete